MTDDQLPRLWKEAGRQFAYIKDVFDLAVKRAQALAGAADDPIICYTNADIHVRADCSLAVAACLYDASACFAYRRDFGRLDGPLAFAAYATGHAYAGSDLAAFRVSWWLAHRREMADMILGLEAWDPIFRHLAQMTNPGRDISVRDVIGHERHGSYWERPENRYTLEGQKYCIRTAYQWMLAHGIDPHSHGINIV